MLTARTIIGNIVGAAIILIGSYFLITSFGLQAVDFDDTYLPGESETYQFYAPRDSKQEINITGDTFQVALRSPEGGMQIDTDEEYKEKLSVEWTHVTDGISILKLNNTGNSDLNAKGTFTTLTEPIFITFHILVIISGVVIIGFSAGFSVRKPKGF